MSNKKLSDQAVDETATAQDKPYYSRREFLQKSAKGVGVTALGATAFGVAGLTESDEANARNGVTSQCEGAGMAPIPRMAVLGAVDPDTSVDTWVEPWVWRPTDWPNKDLDLTVVENAAPVAVTGTGFENVRPLLLSYGGVTPGPTIRMAGDKTLSIQLRNLLGTDEGETITGPYPDPNALPPGNSDRVFVSTPDWCLGEHTNGVHSVNTTNLHTHGLHVRPGSNPDGSISDNIILRVMPQGDFLAREDAEDESCRFLRVNEQVGDADYEFRLGNIGDNDEPHPPGTHWYHPHSHGATHNQVASGMAGFFIVEGDVDEAVAIQLAGEQYPNPDPQTPTGKYQYRERLIFMQNVNPGNIATDPDDDGGKGRQAAQFPTVNGSFQPKVMVMRPGAIERWRVLNGSVDGRGYIRFAILKGQYTICENGQIGLQNLDGTCTPLDTSTVESLKQVLVQLSWDGVTLVHPDGNGGYEYGVKNLSFSAPPNPLDLKSNDSAQERIDKIANCYANEANVKAAYNRPNELLLAPANRSDVFFQAPFLSAGDSSEIYTVVALLDILHNDNYEKQLRQRVAQGNNSLPNWPGDNIVSYVVVKGDPVDGGPIDATAFPPVPDYLIPITDEEVQITSAQEAANRGVQVGEYRTRVVTYSGWGNADFPIIDVPEDFVNQNPDLNGVIYSPITVGSDQNVLLPANIRTMSIDGMKFDPDGVHPQMWLGSSEEWVVYNNSQTLWAENSTTDWPPHFAGQAVTRSQAEAMNFSQITTTTVDHPFHIHVNPFWLSRMDVPLADGSLVNIVTEPRWQDVVWLPRGRGRAVFRSRFPDYVGQYVNHCHILLHEDNGMMQLVEVVAASGDSNYEAKFEVTQPGMSPDQVTAIYPRVSLDEAFTENASFNDPNPNTGQVYPGFDVTPNK